ncbi:XVIPCD domain-containing protein [Rhodanobacter sp. Col0626]|uniref:XVIPCD domain-containing protein n=1 Tax=Rhodanobacter sp. Col0626 TaxID=3415679 RepID=UPI003CE837F1
MATDREAQLLVDATKAGITSPRELANFMAQVSAESQGLTRLEEGFRYTRGISQIPVKYAHREGDQALEAARVDALKGKPEALAELMYGGRMGNDQPGDGYKYRGRGYMQLTGKENYEAAGKALGLDLVKDPDLASDPKNASKIATWYWENRVPEKAHADVKAATLAINGGYNGLDTRQAQFEKWQKNLTPEVMERLSKGDVGLPLESAKSSHHDTSKAATETVLTLGANGASVHALQNDLNKLGYTGADGKSLPSTGHFGSDTKHAVENFQRDHHLVPVDGKVGHDTRLAMHAAMLAKVPPALDDKRNPDHALYQQVLVGVHKIDAGMGRTPDQQSINLAAALTVAAKAQGLTRIDTVALSEDGSRTFAAQNALPLMKLADVATAQAVHTPIEQSNAAAAAMISHQTNTLAQPTLQELPHPAVSM